MTPFSMEDCAHFCAASLWIFANFATQSACEPLAVRQHVYKELEVHKSSHQNRSFCSNFTTRSAGSKLIQWKSSAVFHFLCLLLRAYIIARLWWCLYFCVYLLACLCLSMFLYLYVLLGVYMYVYAWLCMLCKCLCARASVEECAY